MRVIFAPRDDKGRLRVRRKGRQVGMKEGFWEDRKARGFLDHQIARLWREFDAKDRALRQEGRRG